MAVIVAKVQWLQRGRPQRHDCRMLNRLHRQQLARIDWMRQRYSMRNSLSHTRQSGVGASNAEVFLCDCDATWMEEARREAATLRAALGAGIEVHHIGSTAVDALAAKPIVDLAIALPRTAFAHDFPRVRRALERLGYRYLGVRGGLFFEKGPAPVRTHALQVHTIGGAVLLMLLHFRDLLRADADLREEYTETKAALAMHLPRRRWIYAIYKGHWIQEQQWRDLGATGWGEWFVAHHRARADLARASKGAK